MFSMTGVAHPGLRERYPTWCDDTEIAVGHTNGRIKPAKAFRKIRGAPMGGLGSSRPACQDRHGVEKGPAFLSIDTATSARPPPTAGHQILCTNACHVGFLGHVTESIWRGNVTRARLRPSSSMMPLVSHLRHRHKCAADPSVKSSIFVAGYLRKSVPKSDTN